MSVSVIDQPAASAIVPVYNQENSIACSIESLMQQSIGFDHLQIIIVDDGSTDRSMEICKQMADQHANILLLGQENRGVSAARNLGIRSAQGKYLFFLDADDCLEPNTIQNVVSFFDSCEDDIDLVTYPIETHYNNSVLAPHFRYKVLTKSGVYSLRQYAYIGQTTMNIAVRNLFQNNVLFHEEQTFSEDQTYCCDVLKRTLKMGYCKEGKYIYYRSQNTSSGRLAGACYIFEQSMRFFETLFSEYQEVPLAFQGLYMNDIYWKLCSNILLPWHYEEKEYREAFQRIVRLLNRCRDDVILQHPNMDFFEKYYLLRIKENNQIQYLLSPGHFDIYDGSVLAVEQDSVEIVVTRMRVDGDRFLIEGFLKTVLFQFYRDEIALYAEENGERKQKLDLKRSSHSYYLSHEPTQWFYAFSYSCSLKTVRELTFSVKIDQYFYPVTYYFMPLVGLSNLNQIDRCQKGQYRIAVEQGRFRFSACSNKNETELWLYYDCSGVEKDNGRIQFEHDITVEDEVERYYVVTDERQKNPSIPEKYYVEFGSGLHRELLKNCSKIITSFIEDANLFPYDREELDIQSSKFDFEVVYLQHGVMHFIMPWKYSRERIAADRIVISTKEEELLWKENGYTDSQLIRTGMPRLDFLKKGKSRKRILYAPSWRAYLVGQYINHQWEPLRERFLSSAFYRESDAFLRSDFLRKILDESGFDLDVKLHPIFQMYQGDYHFSSDRIRFYDGTVSDGEYDMMITDYSSYAYNFHYLGIPVLYFIPDEMEFKCGMNGFRKLDCPDSFWEQAAFNSQEIIMQLSDWFDKGMKVRNDLHFYKCEDRSMAIYNTVKQKAKNDIVYLL